MFANAFVPMGSAGRGRYGGGAEQQPRVQRRRLRWWRCDRDVEIVADRGIDAKVGAEGWETICRDKEAEFRAGNFERGVIKGIEAVSRELARHFPPDDQPRNELPDKPVVMSLHATNRLAKRRKSRAKSDQLNIRDTRRRGRRFPSGLRSC
jgi:hypothetical protein